MNLLSVKALEFKGDDEMAMAQTQAVEPTFYDDGTAEVQVHLAGKDRSVYVRLNIAELVRLRAEAVEVEDAPEQ